MPLELQPEVNFGKNVLTFFLNSSTNTTFIVTIISLPMHYKFKFIKQLLWICATSKHKNKTK